MYKFFVVIFLLAVFQPISSFSDSKCPSLFEVKSQESANLRNLVLDEDGKVREKFKGRKGLILIAKKYFDGDLRKAFLTLRYVLSEHRMGQLQWRLFSGTIDEFKDLESRLLDKKGNIREEHKGIEGQMRNAMEFYKGSMYEVFERVQFVLGDKIYAIGWKVSPYNVKKTKGFRDILLDEDGKVREKFKNMEGQALLSEEYFAGKNMWDVFWLTSTVLDTKDFLQLNWQQLDLTLEEYKKMRSYLLDSDGNGKEKYKGARGISFFANRFFKKDREKALLYATKVFGEKVLKQLAWWEQAQMAVKRAQIDAKNRAQNRRGVINSIRLRNKRNNISMR